MKNNPLPLREQYTHKTTEEQQEYGRFISNNITDNSSDNPNVERKKQEEEVFIPLIGKKTDNIDETDSVQIEEEKKGKETKTKDLTPRRKKTKWEHFKGKWNRKWADNLVEMIFKIFFWLITYGLTALATFYITRHNFEYNSNQLKEEIIKQIQEEQKLPEKSIETTNNLTTTVDDIKIEKDITEKNTIIGTTTIKEAQAN